MSFFSEYEIDKKIVFQCLLGYFIIGQSLLLPIVQTTFSMPPNTPLGTLSVGTTGVLFAIFFGRVSYLASRRLKPKRNHG
jgi:uncharacterized protein involved in response to NO